MIAGASLRFNGDVRLFFFFFTRISSKANVDRAFFCFYPVRVLRGGEL